MLLLTLWTVLAPWHWERIYPGGFDIYGRRTDSYGVCISSNESKKLARLIGILLGVVNIVPIVLSLYQSYMCRNLPSEFNESRYVAISMASLLETCAIGLPIVLVAVDPTAVFLTRAVALCMACLAILLPMFVPKFVSKRRGTAPRPRMVSVGRTNPNAASLQE